MSKSLYEYPQYFDMAFADETQAEAAFINDAWQRFGQGRMHRVLDPGCGSGRLVRELAAQGMDVTGFDLSKPALSYLKRRLRGKRLMAHVSCADMVDFHFDRRFDLAHCTMNTFRHLVTQADALSHLQCVARHLRRGGLYILGFHLIPPDADEQCVERWRASRGQTSVCFTLRVLDFCRRRRLETIRISMLARTPRGIVRGRSEFPLRLYKASQFRNLIAQIPSLELLETYNFDYDLDDPQPFDDELADAVFVFRKT